MYHDAHACGPLRVYVRIYICVYSDISTHTYKELPKSSYIHLERERSIAMERSFISVFNKLGTYFPIIL